MGLQDILKKHVFIYKALIWSSACLGIGSLFEIRYLMSRLTEQAPIEIQCSDEVLHELEASSTPPIDSKSTKKTLKSNTISKKGEAKKPVLKKKRPSKSAS